MKILTIANAIGGISGTEKVAHNYVTGYKESGEDSRVLAYSLNGGTKWADDLGIEVFIADEDHKWETIVQQITAWAPDVIHLHREGFADPRSAKTLKALKGPQTKVMETNHFARVDYSENGSLVDLHLHLSKYCLWKWQQWSRSLKPRPLGTVLYHPQDLKNFNLVINKKAARKELGLAEDLFLFGTIARPAISKWSPVSISAFQQIAGQHDKVRLVLISPPQAIADQIAALPAAVQEKIIALPVIRDDKKLSLYYQAFDCFLHASRIGESFGMVLVESLLHELPVISLNTPLKDNSQGEVMGHNIGGLLVANGQEMVKAMNLLIGDDALRTRLAKDGKRHALESYNKEKIVALALKIATALLASSNKKELETRLNQAGFLTRAGSKAVFDNMMGSLSLKEKIMIPLIHNPTIYRAYLKLRG